MLLSAIQLIFTEYDLSDSHDLSVAIGSIGISLFILIAGLAMQLKADQEISSKESFVLTLSILIIFVSVIRSVSERSRIVPIEK